MTVLDRVAEVDAPPFTSLPRWATSAARPSHVHRIPIGTATTRVTRTRGAAALVGPAVAQTITGAVLAAMTGDEDVTFGWRTPDEAVHPVTVSVRGTWADLIDRLVDAPSVEVSSDGPSDLVGEYDAERDELVLRIGADLVDSDATERIAGYHHAAARAIADDPDVWIADRTLLSDTELDLQLHGMAGPVRPLPDVRVAALIAERARQHPDRIAARCGAATLTYDELDRAANRVARSLLRQGLQAEDVVAVVTERHLDWLVAVLAVLRSGGTYLPIEPHFPADRVARSLSRSACRFVLTETGSAGSIPPSVATLDVADLMATTADPRDDTDPEVMITADQRAYIYFTSGSTGEPKGAMCEHAGMLNHVLAKIEDLGIREGDAVAQIAPQCFDISLWQLLAALVVGGETVIIEQTDILDLPRMLDRLTERRVAVAQLVPSYLEVLLSHLDTDPRTLSDLRTVSVTGEAVKAELVRRFFAAPAMTGVALVNAYGLTETSDDTNHEVMHTPTLGDRVPLGAPVRNVVVYVVDTQLRPVPLGAPGEIVFSGVCVGRGYVNDPDRTTAVFGVDPYRPGSRFYRSGDIGRWRPDGKLEFLGRRDGQVKIAGFRIELGEIEAVLTRVAGVRDGAVVVITGADGSRHLVGFYTAGPDAEVVTDALARELPGYMVPRVLHRRDRLPLSDNGKIDRRALTRLADALVSAPVGSTTGPPALTPIQRRVARAWSAVLGVEAEQLTPTDHFFDRGGTSLSAVKVVIALGRAITVAQVTTHPVLADLAALLDATDPPAQKG